MNLNLGCADDTKDDCINVDIVKYNKNVDVIHDLNILPWPWTDSVFDSILAFDIIEHLRDKINTMNECYRVLKPGGQLHILVPTTNGMAAFADPTHVTFWNEYSFKYFIEGTDEHKRFAKAYGITARYKRIGGRLAYLKNDPNSGERLEIFLEAIKNLP